MLPQSCMTAALAIRTNYSASMIERIGSRSAYVLGGAYFDVRCPDNPR
jgi:hypothetical protein